MKQIILSALVLWLSAPLAAQQNWQISGYIRSETGEALPGSLVQINDSTGMVADADGFFRIQSDARPAVLIARCLGYFPRRIALRNDDFQGQKVRVDVVLTAQETAIQEVSITAKKVEVLAEENFSTDIYDYAFAGEHLLLLLRERKRYYIRLVSESGEKLDELQLDGQPTLLHRSCTGNLHLAGGLFAQELTVNGLHLDTFPRYSLRKFRQFVLPCVQQSRGYYFFRVTGLFNQSVTYVYFDPEQKRHLLAIVRDEAGEAEAMQAYDAFRSGAPVFIHQLESLPGIDAGFPSGGAPEPADIFSEAALQQYASSHAQLAHWSWLQSIKMDSVYAPLLKIGDTLLLFDHVKGALRRFDATFSDDRTVPLAYQQDDGWQKDLVLDETSRKVYGRFAPGGRQSLRRIDLATGRVNAEYPLPEVTYISRNFRMRNGFLYFLGRADANVPNASLYKVSIFQNQASK